MPFNQEKVDVTFISIYSDIQCYNIRRLSAFLKNKGFTTRIIFMPQPFLKPYSNEAIKQLVDLSRNARLICVSVMSNYWDNAVQVTQAIKELNIPIIWGGVHTTIRPEECLEIVDMIGIGEGDDTLSMLISKIKNNESDYTNIPNLYYKKSGQITKNKLQIFERTDEIQIPDLELENHYILFRDKIRKMDIKLFRCFYGEEYVIQCTFGCPYGCAYCCNNAYNRLFGFNFRKRKMEDVIKELKYIKNKFPFINRVRIDDDNFFCYSIPELEFFRDNYKEHINLPLSVRGGHPLTIKKDVIKICVDAGMYRIGMGIQTGSENTKKIFKRQIPNKAILEACRVITSFKGLVPTYDMILDTPWETKEDVIETLRFILEIPHPYHLALFSMTLFAGTELFEKALNDGIIKDIKNEVYRKNYASLKDTYLNTLFPLFTYKWVPRKFKEFLLTNKVRNSNFKGIIKSFLKGIRVVRSKWGLIKFLTRYIIKFDLTRTIFSIKKYYYDRKYLFSTWTEQKSEEKRQIYQNTQ
ncbi:MAG: radical SAM protein [Candidatus Woesearchaeota archaeon]